MTPAQLHSIEEIFHSALSKESGQVPGFLDIACKGDELLRAKIETLLRSHQRAGDFIETPAIGIATKVMEQEQPDLLVDQIIGHYKLLQRIGAGGMGNVYLATDLNLGRKAALKLLPASFPENNGRLKRFEQEARAVVALNHPNILTVYEIGENETTHYIASELIDGETLRQRLTRGPMRVGEAVEVAIQVASALAAAHDAGIVHRDIKLDNIMLRPDGYVKVLDFGIAKLSEPEAPLALGEEEALLLLETNPGSIVGTVRYMSPEQALGLTVDKRTDIWSLGVVLYEMVSGRPPFRGDTAKEVMNSTQTIEPPPLRKYIAETPDELQQIISRALRKKPSERHESAHELLKLLKALRRRIEFKDELARSTSPASWLSRARFPVAAMVALLVAALGLAISFNWRRTLPTQWIPEKSIAVLPFKNFSDNKENAFFAAGIEDDVLTSLAQIHDLKVISRTSVMAYQKPGKRNMREISDALGVANILEGSVRRTGDRVLLNVQLIDARNDRHLWAQRYDRAVADSIGLQGELATQIATALKATLAPEEKARLVIEPTAKSEAYVLYLTALGKEGTDEIAAEQLYVQAAAVDPMFALAYARASLLNSRIAGYDQPGARKAKARAQAVEAIRLSPALGEAHKALGLSLYWGKKDYEAALKEFELAAADSSNDAEVYTFIAGIYRRQGRWQEAVASFERALSFDPRNVRVVFLAALNHLFMRDWAGAAACYKRALEIAPGDVDVTIGLAYLEVVQNSNPTAARKILQSIPPAIDPEHEPILARWDLAMLERDYAGAEKTLADFRVETLSDVPKTFYQGRTALAGGDVELAQRYFAVASAAMEKRVHDEPDSAERHAELALLYAYMQRKEDAIREGRRAVELEPESQDAFHGAAWAANLALVYTLVGDQDQAITLIERLLTTPGALGSGADPTSNITLAEFRLRWEWDSLRSNPRFQKLLPDSVP